MNKLSDRNIVKQSHILNNASYKFSALAIDIIMTMVTEIRMEDIDFNPSIIAISSLEKKINKRIDRRILSNLSLELMTPIIKIELENGGFIRTAWFSSFEYKPNQGLIELSFDPKLKPYLLELKENFVLGYLSEITPLKSQYTKRIYMLLRQRSNIGKYSIAVYELQKVLNVPKTYLEYKVFKSRVLTPSIKAINKTSSMKISLIEVKLSRKVQNLTFIIKTIKTNKVNNTGIKVLEDWYNNQ